MQNTHHSEYLLEMNREVDENGDSESCKSNEESDDDSDDMRPLLGNKDNVEAKNRSYWLYNKSSQSYMKHKKESKYRAMLLSLSLSFTLMGFWVLDSLKEPVFAVLTQNLERHQPLGKMVSVASILAIVCMMEIISHEHSRKKSSTMITPALIWNCGLPYCFLFSFICWSLRQHPEYATNDELGKSNQVWMALGYLSFVSIESFGSISVAAFWSFTNSNLDLESAKQHYGLIIAVGQLGAICGATIATRAGSASFSVPSLFLVATVTIVANIVVMKIYNNLFPLPLKPLKPQSHDDITPPSHPRSTDSYRTPVTSSKVFMSGVYLILRHNYLLLILGVSCLYEIALTCLDYEFKLVSFAKFTQLESSSEGVSIPQSSDTYAQFIGRYGQIINLFSLFLSFYGFPLMINRLGLRLTLRVFPALLVIATVFAFVLPNIWVLFLSLALLKAVVYSIFDPTKEILYMPTSTTVKFKAKFWIDVVGERLAKALGSSITNYAGSAERLAEVGILPSVLSSCLLLFVSIRAGNQFDDLIFNGEIVGLEEEYYEQNPNLNYERLKKSFDDDDYDWDYFHNQVMQNKFRDEKKIKSETELSGIWSSQVEEPGMREWMNETISNKE